MICKKKITPPAQFVARRLLGPVVTDVPAAHIVIDFLVLVWTNAMKFIDANDPAITFGPCIEFFYRRFEPVIHA